MTDSAELRSMFAEHKTHISQYLNGKLFISKDQALLIYELFVPYISISTRVACTGPKKEKYEKSQGENWKRGNEVQIEGSNTGETFHRSIGPSQNFDKINGQFSLE